MQMMISNQYDKDNCFKSFKLTTSGSGPYDWAGLLSCMITRFYLSYYIIKNFTLSALRSIIEAAIAQITENIEMNMETNRENPRLLVATNIYGVK